MKILLTNSFVIKAKEEFNRRYNTAYNQELKQVICNKESCDSLIVVN